MKHSWKYERIWRRCEKCGEIEPGSLVFDEEDARDDCSGRWPYGQVEPIRKREALLDLMDLAKGINLKLTVKRKSEYRLRGWIALRVLYWSLFVTGMIAPWNIVVVEEDEE